MCWFLRTIYTQWWQHTSQESDSIHCDELHWGPGFYIRDVRYKYQSHILSRNIFHRNEWQKWHRTFLEAHQYICHYVSVIRNMHSRYISVATRTTRTPAFWGYPPPPHDYPYHWVILNPKSKEDKVKVSNLKNSLKFQIFEFWNGHSTRHTFWSCLIRCANMKWIRWVFLKIQSGHDSVHRRTDGQGDTSIPPYQLSWSGGYNNHSI